MKLRVIKQGRPVCKEYENLVERYIKRLNSSYQLESKIIKSNASLDDYIGKSGGLCVLLDERGKSISSTGFSKFLSEARSEGHIKHIDFIIGGPYGLDEKLRRSSKHLWKLSDMVLPSDLAWLILWEQLYRAHSILMGSNYHHA